MILRHQKMTVAAGSMLTLGGEKLLEKGLTILEPRLIGDVETKSTQIISEGGKNFIIDDAAQRTAQHVADKHIDEVDHPDLSSRKLDINTVDDADNYIRETLNNAPNNPDRYEIESDARNDRLTIWDKVNNIMTIFNSKANRIASVLDSLYKTKE